VPLIGLFAVPNSVQAITPLVGQIQIESEARRAKGEYARLYLFHNRPKSGALYDQSASGYCHSNAPWQQGLAKVSWPTMLLPEVMGSGTVTLRALIREYLFHLALSGVRRIPRERKRKPPGCDGTRRQNIDELLETLHGTFHRIRQADIDEELFDVISGFEALNTEEK